MPDHDPTTQRLADMRDRSEKAGPGPWRRYETIHADNYVVAPRGFLGEDVVAGPTYNRWNTELIAHARTDLDDLRGAIEDVLALHVPGRADDWEDPDDSPIASWLTYPCPTVRAITARLGGG